MKKHKQSKLKNLFVEHIKNNARDYSIILILFVVGIVIGVLFINNTSEIQKQEITSYINTYIDSFKDSNAINYVGLIKDSLLKNMSIAAILWFIGIAVTLVPFIYCIIVFRGFCLGYTISSAVAILGVSKGLLFSGTLLLLQNILIIPAIFAIAFSGIRLHNKIIKTSKNSDKILHDKVKHGKENIKLEILRHSVFSFLMMIILFISSFIEVYISANLFGLIAQYI